MPKTTGRWTCWMLHASSHKSWKLKTWLPGDVPLSIGPWQPERVPRKTMSLFLRLQGASVANGRSEVKTGLQCRVWWAGSSGIFWNTKKLCLKKRSLIHVLFVLFVLLLFIIIIYVDHYILFLFSIVAIIISIINISIIYEWKTKTYTIYYHTYIDYDHICM